MPIMATENSVYLIKDFSFKSSRDGANILIPIHPTRVHITAVDADRPVVESALVHSISNYFQELRAADRRFSHFFLHKNTRNNRWEFYHFLSKLEVERLCAILPGAFLRVRCQMKDQITCADRTTFEKRLELTDIWKTLQSLPCTSQNQPLSLKLFKLFSTADHLDCHWICDVILGWTETVEAKVKPLKIEAGFIIEKLYGEDDSKDLRLVAGDGAEVKCHRIVFQAHGDVLSAMLSPSNGMKESATGIIEMKENTEKGLSLLVRYFYGMELTPEELLSSVDVALELFKTADKYLLADLKEYLGQFLLRKGKEWLTPGALIELYFHVKYLAEWKNLEEHALSIMLSLSQEVRSCEKFQELSRDEVADLLWKLLEIEQRKTAAASATPSSSSPVAKRKRMSLGESPNN